MLNSKQRAFLRGITNDLESVFQIGKNGVSDHSISQINDYLTAHEIMKIKLLKSEDENPSEIARNISLITDSEVVSVVGRKFTLYRKSEKLVKEGKNLILPK